MFNIAYNFTILTVNSLFQDVKTHAFTHFLIVAGKEPFIEGDQWNADNWYPQAQVKKNGLPENEG